MELDLERQQRISLELQLNSMKLAPKLSYDVSEPVYKPYSAVAEQAPEMEVPAELVAGNCSPRMLQ